MAAPGVNSDQPATGVPPRAGAGGSLHACADAALLENPDVWLTVADGNGAVLLWNRGAERISGHTRHDVVGRADVWEKLFPDERYCRGVRGRCLQPPAADGQGDVEVAIRCRDGRVKVLLWHVSPAGDGASGGCLIVGRESNDRPHTVQVLEHPEAMFERFLSSLNVGVFRVTLQSPGRSMTANPALARMLGFGSTQELLAWGYERLLPPDERSRVREQLAASGALQNLELRLLGRDGSAVDVAVSAQAEYDEQGRLRVVTGTIQDIGKRKAARQALKASEEKYRQLVEGVGEPIFTVDAHGICLAMNQVAAHYAGGEPEDFEGKALWDIFPADVAGAFVAITHEAVDTDSAHTCELEAHLQGRKTWLQVRVQPLRGLNGDVPKVQILALDVTGKKATEQAVMQYQERLRALAARLSDAEERERRRLAADLHDGVSQALALAIMKLGVLEGAMARHREVRELREITALTEQALQAARTLTSELSPPVLAEFGFDEALDWLAERASERYGMPVHVQHHGVPQDLPGQVLAVLFRAVRELLVNVGRHAQATKASVTTRTEGTDVVVVVSDDGRGIGEGLEMGRVGKGGGFGLFNVREQLGQLGGRMEVQARPGGGTCLKLSMPLGAGGASGQGDSA